MHRRLLLASLGLLLVLSSVGGAQHPEQSVLMLDAVHVVVGTAPVQLPSTAGVRGVSLQALLPSGGAIYVNRSNAVSALNGWRLVDGQSMDLGVSNANQFWAVATAPDQRLVVWPHRRQ